MPRFNSPERGAIKLSVIIAATLGLGLGASMFLNFQQHQRAEQDKRLMQGEITDLRYQVKEDKLASGGAPSATPGPSASPGPLGKPSPSPGGTPSPEPSPTPAVLGDTAPRTAVVKDAANLRSDARANASLVMRVPKGAVATLGSDLRNGYQQITINGKTGYLLASYLQ